MSLRRSHTVEETVKRWRLSYFSGKIRGKQAYLLQRLRTKFGINGTALSWMVSFLSDRTQQVFYKRCLSKVLHLLLGVPQGSVLGLILFLLYVSDLFGVIAECGFTSHAYADDTQLYISVVSVPWLHHIHTPLNVLYAVLSVYATGWAATA